MPARTRPLRAVAALATLATGAALLAGCSDDSGDDAGTPPPAAQSSSPPASPSPSGSSGSASGSSPDASASLDAGARPRVVGTVAENLEAPWGLAFLPDGRAVVTERDSRRVLLVDPDASRVVREIGVVQDAAPQGEAGLLGVAVSPDFARDRRLFLYLTTAEDNRVVRTTLREDRLGRLEPILTGIPNGFIHDGGRMVFGPDGHLYVSTGEAGEPERAQDRDDLGGKILRITPDGDPAPGNPSGSPVFSWGHRNVQGLAFVGDQLWASEFGADRFDELNRIRRGADYGWPEVEGTGGGKGRVDPEATWSTDDASPSGLAYASDHLWMAALRGERLWRVPVTADGTRIGEPRSFLVGDYGRMRTVAVAPDGMLWVTTSNRDGRGEPAPQDDRILLVRP